MHPSVKHSAFNWPRTFRCCPDWRPYTVTQSKDYPQQMTPTAQITEDGTPNEAETLLTLGHSAREAAYSAILQDDITEAEQEATTHRLRSEADAAWKKMHEVICNLPEHRKAQLNHPDPVGPPLDYMGERQVFDGIRSDIYDLCRFYILGMTGDPPEFPTPQEPATRGQIRDLLKSARAIGRPYLILVHSADSVTAISMLRELHTAACL